MGISRKEMIDALIEYHTSCMDYDSLLAYFINDCLETYNDLLTSDIEVSYKEFIKDE